MRNGVWTKGLVVGIIMLFIGTSVLPGINAKEEVYINISDENNPNESLFPLDQLDQYQYSASGASFAENEIWLRAQSFKPSLDSCTKVILRTKREGNPSGNVIVSIRESLNGIDLTSVTKAMSSFSDYYDSFEFDFPDISVIPEKTYYIVFASRIQNWDGVVCSSGVHTSYDRGELWYWTDYGGWRVMSPEAEMDLWFEEYALSNQSPPETPSKPSGPSSGTTGTSYTFSTSTTDQDNDKVKYGWDWNGDSTVDEWTSLKTQGTTVSTSHTWDTAGTYNVKVKAEDEHGAQSGWSTALTVTITSSVVKPTVSTKDATDVEDTIATLNGNLDNLGKASSCEVWFEYGPTTSYGTITSHQTKTSTGSFSQSISSLTESKTYHYRAVAKNSAGTTNGSDKTFTTVINLGDLPDWVYALLSILPKDKVSIIRKFDTRGMYWEIKLPLSTLCGIPSVNGNCPNVGLAEPFKGKYGFTQEFDGYIKIKSYPQHPQYNTFTYVPNTIEVTFNAYSQESKIPIKNTNRAKKAGVDIEFYATLGEEFKAGVRCTGTYTVPLVKIQTAIWVIPVTIEAGVFLKIFVNFYLASPVEWTVDNSGLNPKFEGAYGGGDASFGFGGYAQFGVGVKDIIEAGVNFKAGGDFCFKLAQIPPYNFYFDKFVAHFTISLYAQVWIWRSTWQIYESSWTWNPLTGALVFKNMTKNPNACPTGDPVFELIPREYGQAIWTGNNTGELVKEVFPLSDPALTGNDTRKMMVWVEDDFSKDPAKGLELRYSLWSDESKSWSSPGYITRDNALESDPSVALLDNGNAMCVFTYIPENTPLTYTDYFKSSEIGYSIWDRNTGQWTPVQLVSPQGTPESMDSFPRIVSDGNTTVIVWMCDKDTNIFTVNDRVLYASYWNNNHWHTPVIISNRSIVSTPVSLAFKDNKIAVAYAVDEDGTLETRDDQNIYLTTFDISAFDDSTKIRAERVTDDAVKDASPSVSFLSGTPVLVWARMKQDNISELRYRDVQGVVSTVITGNVTDPTIFSTVSGAIVIGYYDSLLYGIYKAIKTVDGWNISKVYFSSRLLTKANWDFNSPYGFVLMEKDEPLSLRNCSLIFNYIAPPNKPVKPSGPNSGIIGVEYNFSSSTTDPNGERLFYLWDWGDGNTSEWFGPYDPGVTCKASYVWEMKGSHNVKVKAKTEHEVESVWSDSLPITMPYSYNPILQFLELLFQRFPHAFPLLRQLLRY